MLAPRSLFAACLLTSAVVVAPAHAQTVWLVDPSGTADFTQIQQAVNAASDGDLIKVGAGSYASFVVDDKQLGIFAEDGALVQTGTIRVRNMSAGKSLSLVGIDAQGVPSGQPGVGCGLFAIQCFGALRFRDCSFSGGLSSAASSWDGWHGANLDACDDVCFSDCWLQGADDLGVSPGSFRQAGHALVATASRTSVFNSQLSGGDAVAVGTYVVGADGGHGARLYGGELYAASSSFLGGDGGQIGECSAAGQGGYGIFSPTGPCSLRNVTAIGGAEGGCAPCGLFACSGFGGPGAATYGPMTILPDVPAQFRAARVASSGGQTILSFDGLPGSKLFLRAAPAAGNEYIAAFHGPLLLQPPLFALVHSRTAPVAWPGVPLDLTSAYLGTLPASGSLQVVVNVSSAPSQIVRLQALMRRSTGVGILADPIDLMIH